MIWDELGIEPTTDSGLIRRAYARRLKSIDTTADPGAFERLRRAYEQALAGGAVVDAPDVVTTEQEPPDEGPSSPWASAEGQAVADAIMHGPLTQAIAILGAPEAGLNLSIDEFHALSLMLRARVVASGEIQGASFIALAEKFGWNRPPGWQDFPDQEHLYEQRLQAEHWWAGLHDLAEVSPTGERADLVHAARILTGRSGTRMAYRRNLAEAFGYLIPPDFHPASRLLGRLDPARVAWCTRVAMGQERLVRWTTTIAKYAPATAFGLCFLFCVVFRPNPIVLMIVVFAFSRSLRQLELPRAVFYGACAAMVLAVFLVPPLPAPWSGQEDARQEEVYYPIPPGVEPPSAAATAPTALPYRSPVGDCGPSGQSWNPLTQDFDFDRQIPCPPRSRSPSLLMPVSPEN